MEFEPYPLKLEQTVNELLKAADLDIATELSIRKEAEKLLGVDLSDLPSKRLIRRIVESFLLSTSPVDDEVREEKENVEEVQTEKFPVDDRNIASDGGGERVICRLPGKRRISIENFRGTKMVSIREFYKKQGNVFTSGKGISLDPKEWSSFCSSFSDIDEAITKMESRMRDKCNGKKQTEAEPSNPSLSFYLYSISIHIRQVHKITLLSVYFSPRGLSVNLKVLLSITIRGSGSETNVAFYI
ncbi:hypothetical protein R6Q57_007505 [Mikania cordata]